jgi:hypothetical protein
MNKPTHVAALFLVVGSPFIARRQCGRNEPQFKKFRFGGPECLIAQNERKFDGLTALARGCSTADQLMVKRSLVLFSITGVLTSCGLLGPQEQVREEPGRTTYRAAEDTSLERPDTTPIPQKVPGESR